MLLQSEKRRRIFRLSRPFSITLGLTVERSRDIRATNVFHDKHHVLPVELTAQHRV